MSHNRIRTLLDQANPTKKKDLSAMNGDADRRIPKDVELGDETYYHPSKLKKATKAYEASEKKSYLVKVSKRNDALAESDREALLDKEQSSPGFKKR